MAPGGPKLWMDAAPGGPYTGGMDVSTRLFTWLRGRPVGIDGAGNRYFTERRPRPGLPARRWVLYNGPAEASAVPAEWHAWLHFTTAEPIPEASRKPWQLPHLPNMTGTPSSYRPPGHDYRGGRRSVTTGDYESWTPGS